MRVIRRIDRGGFGFVEEVETSQEDRVARKTFDPLTRDPVELSALRRRFEREVRIQSAIRHSNIMPVLEAGLSDSPPWFLMPLASMSLEGKLQDDHRNSRFDTQPWPDILAAAEELHRLGYVHRDLKPANILLVQNKWVIADFGLILPTMRDTTILTGSSSAYGSRNYTAPEQTTDFRNTPEQADIYALGCILHDATDPTPTRIPFAQIRTGGIYGPLLEKCTEVDPRRRFPTIAALRAALFDLWRTSSFPPPPVDDAAILQHVLDNPESPEAWRRFLKYVENLPANSHDLLLRAINSDLLLQLNTLDNVLFGRLVTLLCQWAGGNAFEWEYCDVVGDRLLDVYRVGPVRLRCDIVLAALKLAVSHNRWHVMRQAGGMLGTAADNGLVDRLLIEISLDPTIENRLRQIESIIHWPREHWHERIANFLEESLATTQI
ncbi:MAG: Serine/threonine-protein kinase AfsK [Syntrophorhabdus sp. PtaU1.Bin058]|nr:MAG: Serine/threonine-protein kinase AfsK [Syntrophorhabdus sp. PtaU1.Bin058]